jgi:hypothetical protein
VIAAGGLPSLITNDLVLQASQLPSLQFGVFFYGSTETFAIFGDGVRCVNGPIYRLKPPIPTTLGGTVALPIDLATAPFSGGPSQITAGSTWHFQFWFRDPQGGPAGFNTSDGLRVTFCP